MVQPRAGQGAVQIALRLPADLRDKIKEAAEEAGRSMNSEILARLEQSFSDQKAFTDEIYKHLDTVIERTIRIVRAEERASGLPPLETDEGQ